MEQLCMGCSPNSIVEDELDTQYSEYTSSHTRSTRKWENSNTISHPVHRYKQPHNQTTKSEVQRRRRKVGTLSMSKSLCYVRLVTKACYLEHKYFWQIGPQFADWITASWVMRDRVVVAKNEECLGLRRTFTHFTHLWANRSRPSRTCTSCYTVMIKSLCFGLA